MVLAVGTEVLKGSVFRSLIVHAGITAEGSHLCIASYKPVAGAVPTARKWQTHLISSTHGAILIIIGIIDTCSHATRSNKRSYHTETGICRAAAILERLHESATEEACTRITLGINLRNGFCRVVIDISLRMIEHTVVCPVFDEFTR